MAMELPCLDLRFKLSFAARNYKIFSKLQKVLLFKTARPLSTNDDKSAVHNSCAMSTDVDLNIKIKRAAKAIKDAKAIIITAGAGIGVDSGLPDFRGPEGLWKAYPPLKKLGLTLPEMSTPRWFIEDPPFAWGFFGHRLQLYRSTKPHKGFQILKNWADSKPNGYFVFTSNVDGHFQKAGFSEERVVECHGSINYMQCIDGSGDTWPCAEEVEVDEKTLNAKEPLPMGPPDEDETRQKLARPNILMFNDWHFVETRLNEQLPRYEDFIRQNCARSQDPFVVVELGAGLAVPTVRWRGEELVEGGKNGFMVRINPRDTDIPNKRQFVSLPLGGLDALEKIEREIQKL